MNNPLLEFGKKIRESIDLLSIKPNWITVTETEINFWLYEPKFNEQPSEYEDFEWYFDDSTTSWYGSFIMTAPMLDAIKSFYSLKEYIDADSENDYFRQFKMCKEYIGD